MDRHAPKTSSSTFALLITCGILVIGCGGFVVARRVDDRLSRLDAAELQRSLAYASIESQLDELGSDLVQLRGDLQETTFTDQETRDALTERLASTELRLGSIGTLIDAQASSLEKLEEVQATFVPELEAELAELAERDERLQKRWENLRELASSASEAADESQRRVQEIAAPRDLRRMWRELVGPVVQIAGDTSVGSGVLLPSQLDATGDAWETYLLTAWHVVRDIQGEPADRELPVSVAIYYEDGTVRREMAELLCFEADLDAALLIVRSQDDLAHGAALATPDRLGDVRIFDEVYAVGCPLGNDPIPTRGEIATCNHSVDGETYWMINAPTYIGNSGGGIFDGRTHELLGIFSKIYTHGSLRPTIVPHMGLVTPLSSIYEWLEGEGHGNVFAAASRAELASADR